MDAEATSLLSSDKPSFWTRNGRNVALALSGVAGVLLVTTVAFGVQANSATTSSSVVPQAASAMAEPATFSSGMMPRTYHAEPKAIKPMAASGPVGTKFTWTVTSLRGQLEGTNCDVNNCRMQANEVVFYGSDGQPLGAEAHVATVTADASTTTKETEGPEMLFDMDPSTKFLDQTFAFETEITFEFPADTEISGFTYVTGGEWAARDPVSWTWYLQDDAGDYIVNEETNVDITEDRLTETQQFTFTAPPAPAVAASIVTDYDIAGLDGWTKVYDAPYSDYTTNEDILKCSGYDSIFVGAKASAGASTISVGAFESFSFVESLVGMTCDKAAGRKNPDAPDGGYWYFCDSYSVGFAPTQIISLNSADTYDQADPQRLSWHLHGWVGGWRAGASVWLNSDQVNQKVIYCK